MSTVSYTVAQLAQKLNADWTGNPDCVIAGLAPIKTAQASQLSFVANKKFLRYLQDSKAAAILMTKEMAENFSGNAIVTTQPELAFARIAALFKKPLGRHPGIHPSAVIGEGCEIAEGVSIGANCVVGDSVSIASDTIIQPGTVIGDRVRIGSSCVLHANVTLYHDVVLGNQVVLHSGVVVGADGFGLTRDEQGDWVTVPQLGSVIIHDKVEIGANSCIDRGAIDDTVLSEGVRIDNLVQIAHNVKIGAHTAIAAQTAIAGSVEVGKHCVIAGQVGISGHIAITDQVVLTAKTGVMASIQKPGVYSSGGPALFDHNDYLKTWAHFRKLVQLNRRVKKLEKKNHD